MSSLGRRHPLRSGSEFDDSFATPGYDDLLAPQSAVDQLVKRIFCLGNAVNGHVEHPMAIYIAIIAA